MQIPEFDGIELFTMFQVDIGEGILAQKRARGEEITKDDYKLVGNDLWYFTKRQQARGKVTDFEADSPEEHRRKQKKEQAQRAARMAELANDPKVMKDLQENGLSLTDLLPPPQFA